MKRWWAQRPNQMLAFEHNLQPIKWGRIIQNGCVRTGGKPPVEKIQLVLCTVCSVCVMYSFEACVLLFFY